MMGAGRPDGILRRVMGGGRQTGILRRVRGGGQQAGTLRRRMPPGVRRRPVASLQRRAPATRRVRLARPRPRTVLALLALAIVLGGIWLWLRDSPLVAVRRVEVTGASGPDATHIRSALRTAARGMTTLDVNVEDLRTAVAPYPVVKDLRVDTQFPHGMRIHVVEQVPVAVVDVGGRRTAVAGDGTLLHDGVARSALPMITLRVVPGGTRVTGYTLSEVRLLAAAPYPLLAKVMTVTDASPRGLVVKLRNGPSIYFGDLHRAQAKWTAATEVLADTGSAGASYIDVTDPSRPAAGADAAGGPTAAAGASPSGSTATTANTATSTVAASPTASPADSTTASAGGSTAATTGTTAQGAGG
jgi:cell division protein FtsQ